MSVHPTVWVYSEADNQIEGGVRDAVERIVTKLHVRPNPNSKTRYISIEEIIDCFWTEFEDF